MGSEENKNFAHPAHDTVSPAYADSPGKGPGQFSPQAKSFSVSFDQYYDEIPEGTSGPKYDGWHYSASSDGTHKDK